MIGQYLPGGNNLNIEKIIFKVVQMKFLAMHITNQKWSFDIFTVQNIFMEHDLNILMIFGIKEKCIIFEPYNVLLVIATNIAVLLMTASVLQGHIILQSVFILSLLNIVLLSGVIEMGKNTHTHTHTYTHARNACKHTHTHTRLFLWIVGTFHRLLLLLYP